MEFGHWLSLFSICLLGAMSPGPSLAVVLNATLGGGHRAGYITALAHGAGVGLYGLLTVTGLALLITRSPSVFLAIQLVGAAYLIYLGIKSLRGSGASRLKAEAANGADPGDGVTKKGIMVATVGITDASWYALIVALVSRKSFLEKLQRSARVIDRVFGAILVLLALSVMLRALLQIM